MGVKGNKLTQESVFSVKVLMEKIAPIGNVTSKKMFGGHGIFHEGKMFALIDSQGKAFMKVDDSNRADFDEHKAEQHSRMPYFSIPQEVFNSQNSLILWVKKSIRASK